MFFCETACLSLIYRVHFHSGVLSLHDPWGAPTRRPATTCVPWPTPLTEEPCWQFSVPPQKSPHETATWAETRASRGHGIWPRRPDRVVLSWLTSILAPPSSTQPSLSQNEGGGGLRRARKHAYKSPVCIAPEGCYVPAPTELTWASAQRWPTILGRWHSECHNRCLSLGMCEYGLHNLCPCILYLCYGLRLHTSIHEWPVYSIVSAIKCFGV